jgi:hypothetical protein
MDTRPYVVSEGPSNSENYIQRRDAEGYVRHTHGIGVEVMWMRGYKDRDADQFSNSQHLEIQGQTIPKESQFPVKSPVGIGSDNSGIGFMVPKQHQGRTRFHHIL